jgi:hypothetical protein
VITFTIISGNPSLDELTALEMALEQHERPIEEAAIVKSNWGKPQLRQPLPKKS